MNKPLVINNEHDSATLRNSFGGVVEYYKLCNSNPKYIREVLQKRGYDGLIDNMYNQYAVFEPEQIKIIDII